MPVLYETATFDREVGMECDKCGKVDKDGLNEFVIRYTFGYGSPLDGKHVEAAICDHCLQGLLTQVPGAQWSD